MVTFRGCFWKFRRASPSVMYGSHPPDWTTGSKWMDRQTKDKTRWQAVSNNITLTWLFFLYGDHRFPVWLYATTNLVTHCPASCRPCVSTFTILWGFLRSNCIHWRRSLRRADQPPLLRPWRLMLSLARLAPWYRSHLLDALMLRSGTFPVDMPTGRILGRGPVTM